MWDEESKELLEKPCPNCGGTDFEWGYVVSTEFFMTKGNEIPWISMAKNRTAIASLQTQHKTRRHIHTRICKACTNLQMFATTQKFKPKS